MRGLLAVLILCVLHGGTGSAERPGQQANDAAVQGALPALVEAATRNEIVLIQQQGTFSVRYKEHKVDAKGDTTRLVIESKQGAVARLIERNGQPITAAEDKAERVRLQEAIDHPDDFYKHHRRDAQQRHDATQLVELMPKALLFSYAAGQPQRPDAKSAEAVLDFQPNPAFHPPTMLAEVLTGLQGRVWVDTATQHVTRVEGHVLKPVNFGFGMLAKLYPGGTLTLQQAPAGGGHWIYSDMEEHLTVRALMVKTLPENMHIGASEIQLLPALLSYQDAIRALMSAPIPLR
jgi:hypothetical protein